MANLPQVCYALTLTPLLNTGVTAAIRNKFCIHWRLDTPVGRIVTRLRTRQARLQHLNAGAH